MKKKAAVKFPHYWLCGDCAKNKGGVWPEGHCATVMQGDCPYCGTKNVTIIPWVDFNWPKESRQTNFKAKVQRD